MEHQGEIYILTNKYNNKRYVGQAVCYVLQKNGKYKKHGSEARWKSHIWCAIHYKDRCKVLCEAIRKYGAHSFELKTLRFCDISQLNYYEHKYSRIYNSYTPNGYNIRQSSSKGRHAQITKDIISQKKSGEGNYMFGKHHSKDAKQKISKSNTGKKRTDDHRKKISEAKMKHTGLPQYIYMYNSRMMSGYKVRKHPTLPDRQFVSKNLTMEHKLQMAMDYVSGETVSIQTSTYNRSNAWRTTIAETRKRSTQLPKYIYETNDNVRDVHGYIVRNHPNKKNRQFVKRDLTMEQKLQLAIDYASYQGDGSESKGQQVV